MCTFTNCDICLKHFSGEYLTKIRRIYRAITQSHVTIICSTVCFSTAYLCLEFNSCGSLPSVLVPHATTASVAIEGKMATLPLCRKQVFSLSRNKVQYTCSKYVKELPSERQLENGREILIRKYFMLDKLRRSVGYSWARKLSVR